MRITLKTIKQEESFIDIESTSISVSDLKKLIEEKFNYDSSKIKLLFNGIILNNEKSLQFYDIDENTKIIMSNIKIKQENDVSITNNYNQTEENNAQREEDEEERTYTADIKAEDAIKIVASIMKMLCAKNQDKAQDYFKSLEEDNPEISYLIKKNQAEFKTLLYSPVTSEDKKIYKQFYKGELKNTTESEEPTSNDIENIKQLSQFGFPEELAKEAYFKHSKNFNKALDYLLNLNN